MKLRLLIFVAFISFASCSDDDSGSPLVPQEKNLKSVSVFNNDGNNQMDVKLIYENNKPGDYYLFNAEGEIVLHIKYTYNDLGLLSLTEQFNQSGGLDRSDLISYDALGRISQTISQSFYTPSFPLQKDYVYNNDNTVTCTLSSMEMEPDSKFFIYYLNSEGQVYKIIEDNDYETELNYDYVEEVTYLGDNITTWTRNGYFDDTNEYNLENSVTRTYDMETRVKGQFLNAYKNQYGSYEPNAVLNTGFTAGMVITENYLISSEDMNGDLMEYNYVYDSEGYPISRQDYRNGTFSNEIYIEYQ